MVMGKSQKRAQKALRVLTLPPALSKPQTQFFNCLPSISTHTSQRHLKLRCPKSGSLDLFQVLQIPCEVSTIPLATQTGNLRLLLDIACPHLLNFIHQQILVLLPPSLLSSLTLFSAVQTTVSHHTL